MGVDASGWWKLGYGIETEADFDRLVKPYMPSLGPSFLGLDSATLTHNAWVDPLSVWGTMAAGIVVAGRLRGFDAVDPNAYGSGLVPYGQHSEEQSMTGLVIPNAYLGVIQGVAGGRQITNVIGMLGSAAGQEVAACTALQVAWESSGKPLTKLCFRYTMTGYQVTDLSSTSGGIATIASSTAGGLTASDFSTRAAAALIRWNGGSRDRSTRGRMYFGPLNEDQVDSDGASLTGSALTAIDGAFQQFLNSLSGASFPLAVLSRKYSKATIVSQHTVEAEIATQRRRIRG